MIIEYISFFTYMCERQVWGRVVLGWRDIGAGKGFMEEIHAQEVGCQFAEG